MLRRIGKSDVRLGMHIHSLEGSWLSHPFWRTKFELTDPADLEAIRTSDVEAVVIDDEKGARPDDQSAAMVAEPAHAPSQPTPARQRSAAAAAKRQAAPAPQLSCSLGDEIDRAAQIVDRTKRVVAQLLGQARLGKAVDVARVLPVVEEIAHSVERNASALISITRVRAKDEYTYIHSIAVCALMINLARQMGMDEATVRELGVAGLLHDFGKVAVPDAVLKKPGSLTDTEFSIVRQHTRLGWQALKASGGYSAIVLDVCLQHHEKFDGSGYPNGLKGEEISLYARMAAVCDVYDAITSDRPYKGAFGPAESLSTMFKSRGHFDENVLAAFIRSVGIYPVGSLVRMASDRLAIVVDRAGADAMRPTVRVFYSISNRARLAPVDIDLAKSHEDAIISREDPVRWGFAAWDRTWSSLVRVAPDRLTRAA